ncbi:hypothetical protein MAR_034192, partial [Mya arenaria]
MSPAQEQENPLKKILTFRQNVCFVEQTLYFLTRKEVSMFSLLEFQNSIRSVCKSRGDEWETILGRLECVCHLPTADAQYHQTCCSNLVEQMESSVIWRRCSVDMKKKILRREHGDSESEKMLSLQQNSVNDIRSTECDKTEYPSSAHIMSIEGNRKIVPDSLQFTGDNVEHNTGTLDGHNTFHGMGIVATVTPRDDKVCVVPIIRTTSDVLIKIFCSYCPD